jgi:hypothetical protein
MCLVFVSLSACATHTNHLVLGQHDQKALQVIGLPQISVAKKVDIRQENPLVAIIGLTAKAMQLALRQYKRVKYQDANPELLNQSMQQIRHRIKLRLKKQGYIVKDLPMTYWQAQASYRKQKPQLKDVDALLNIEIKRFGYFSGSPFKPYRPGAILAADLISTQERKTLSSNVYNVGFDPEDLSLLALQVRYITNIHVADKQYFYRNFDALLANAKQSSRGLIFVAKVAAESVAGDLKKNAKQLTLASRK